MLNKCSKQDFISITLLIIVGVVNGLLKTISLAKFLLNFTGLMVSFFLAVMCVLQSPFFFKAKKVMKY